MLNWGVQEALRTVGVFEFVLSNEAAKRKSQQWYLCLQREPWMGICLFLDSLNGAFKVLVAMLELWAAFSLD